MYYDTAWIGGILHFKSHPLDEWQPMKVEELNDRLYAAELELQAANEQIERLGEALSLSHWLTTTS